MKQVRLTKQQKADQLTDARVEAFKYVKDIAVFALTNGSTRAFQLIWYAFQDYEKRLMEADHYIKKHFREHYTLFYVLFTHKTITDAYWDLTPQVKDLWDAVPELKGWREKYR